MYPDDPNLSNPDPDANRLYCELTSGTAWVKCSVAEDLPTFTLVCRTMGHQD